MQHFESLYCLPDVFSITWMSLTVTLVILTHKPLWLHISEWGLDSVWCGGWLPPISPSELHSSQKQLKFLFLTTFKWTQINVRMLFWSLCLCCPLSAQQTSAKHTTTICNTLYFFHL